MKKIVAVFGLAMMSLSITSQAQTVKDVWDAWNNSNNNNNNNSSNRNTNTTTTNQNNNSQRSRNSSSTTTNNNTNGRNPSSNTNNNNTGGNNGLNLNSLSNSDVVGGLRQALEVGAKNAGSKLSIKDGFFGNALIKVMMPPEVKNAENIMRQFGLGSLVDQTVLSMNRAAEDAASKAVPIFINAITTITIQDGLQILTGGSGAATNYLKSRTTAALTTAFRPVIQNSLNKLNVETYWNQLFSNYNQLPIVRNKINPDLTAYVTERALNGLFVTIAQEEANIRANPAARVTSLLQKVFGAK